MKLSSLLAKRQALLRHALLANLAFAHDRLSDFARRVARARLEGEVRLQQAAPGAERFWASLTALHGRQSVIEEHFSDDDLMDLADVIAYATGENEIDLTFRIEELADRFLAPLHGQLAKAGVTIDHVARPVDARRAENSPGCAHADENC
jgi:hypothetical protein